MNCTLLFLSHSVAKFTILEKKIPVTPLANKESCSSNSMWILRQYGSLHWTKGTVLISIPHFWTNWVFTTFTSKPRYLQIGTWMKVQWSACWTTIHNTWWETRESKIFPSSSHIHSVPCITALSARCQWNHERIVSPPYKYRTSKNNQKWPFYIKNSQKDFRGLFQQLCAAKSTWATKNSLIGLISSCSNELPVLHTNPSGGP